MPAQRSQWRKPGLHFAAILFGSGLSLLVSLALIVILAFVSQIPGLSWLLGHVPRALNYIIPQSEAVALFVLYSGVWLTGIAAAYGLIAWVIKPKRSPDRTN